MSQPRVWVLCVGSAPVPGPSISSPGRGVGLAGEPHLRVTCCPVPPPLPTNISRCLEGSFCGFDLLPPAPPPPVLDSSQRDILGWGGWFRGVWGGLFLFVCVCHLSDNSPSSPLALPHSLYLYGTSNKDTRFRLGPPSWAFACSWPLAPAASCSHCSVRWAHQAPRGKQVEGASGAGVSSSSGGEGEGEGCWGWKLLRSLGGLPGPGVAVWWTETIPGLQAA